MKNQSGARNTVDKITPAALVIPAGSRIPPSATRAQIGRAMGNNSPLLVFTEKETGDFFGA